MHFYSVGPLVGYIELAQLAILKIKQQILTQVITALLIQTDTYFLEKCAEVLVSDVEYSIVVGTAFFVFFLGSLVINDVLPQFIFVAYVESEIVGSEKWSYFHYSVVYSILVLDIQTT